MIGARLAGVAATRSVVGVALRVGSVSLGHFSEVLITGMGGICLWERFCSIDRFNSPGFEVKFVLSLRIFKNGTTQRERVSCHTVAKVHRITLFSNSYLWRSKSVQLIWIPVWRKCGVYFQLT